MFSSILNPPNIDRGATKWLDEICGICSSFIRSFDSGKQTSLSVADSCTQEKQYSKTKLICKLQGPAEVNCSHYPRVVAWVE